MTRARSWVGIASLVQLASLLAGNHLGGASGDRTDHRPLLVAGSLVAALSGLALSQNALRYGSLIMVLALAVITAIVGSFTGPVRSAATPQRMEDHQLIAVNSLNQIVVNPARVVGVVASARRRQFFGPRLNLTPRRRELSVAWGW